MPWITAHDPVGSTGSSPAFIRNKLLRRAPLHRVKTTRYYFSGTGKRDPGDAHRNGVLARLKQLLQVINPRDIDCVKVTLIHSSTVYVKAVVVSSRQLQPSSVDLPWNIKIFTKIIYRRTSGGF